VHPPFSGFFPLSPIVKPWDKYPFGASILIFGFFFSHACIGFRFEMNSCFFRNRFELNFFATPLPDPRPSPGVTSLLWARPFLLPFFRAFNFSDFFPIGRTGRSRLISFRMDPLLLPFPGAGPCWGSCYTRRDFSLCHPPPPIFFWLPLALFFFSSFSSTSPVSSMLLNLSSDPVSVSLPNFPQGALLIFFFGGLISSRFAAVFPQRPFWTTQKLSRGPVSVGSIFSISFFGRHPHGPLILIVLFEVFFSEVWEILEESLHPNLKGVFRTPPDFRFFFSVLLTLDIGMFPQKVFPFEGKFFFPCFSFLFFGLFAIVFHFLGFPRKPPTPTYFFALFLLVL